MKKPASKKAAINKSKRRKAGKVGKHRKVIGLIPARGGSKGIKRKNIKILAGYPLVAHSILTLKSLGLSKVYVSTEDKEISAISRQYGASIIVRPDGLAQDDSSLESVIQDALITIDCDILIVVQPTSPMLKVDEVREGLSKFLIGHYDSVFSVVKTNDMLLWSEKLKPINYNPTNRGSRQKRVGFTYIETGGFYIFKPDVFKASFCRICGRVGVSEVSFWTSFQIDEKVDFHNISKLMGPK